MVLQKITENFVSETQNKQVGISKNSRSTTNNFNSQKMAHCGYKMRTQDSPEKTTGSQMHRRLENLGMQYSHFTADISEWMVLKINDAARVA